MNASQKQQDKTRKQQEKVALALHNEIMQTIVEDAYADHALFLQSLLSHKEICAQRRASAYETTSIFTNSINENSSCYNIEVLLNEFHSENELVKLMNTREMLAKCNTKAVTRARIRSHVSHLKRKFANTVKYIEKVDNHVVKFRFELKR